MSDIAQHTIVAPIASSDLSRLHETMHQARPTSYAYTSLMLRQMHSVQPIYESNHDTGDYSAGVAIDISPIVLRTFADERNYRFNQAEMAGVLKDMSRAASFIVRGVMKTLIEGSPREDKDLFSSAYRIDYGGNKESCTGPTRIVILFPEQEDAEVLAEKTLKTRKSISKYAMSLAQKDAQPTHRQIQH